MKDYERIKEIRQLIQSFADRHLNEELTGCVLNLCDKLGRMHAQTRHRPGQEGNLGRSHGVSYCRLNYLFDKTNPCFISTETICDFFGTKKTTIANKASLIERTCRVGLGDPAFCIREIVETFSFVQLPNGMILPACMVPELEILLAEKEESAEIEELIAEKK